MWTLVVVMAGKMLNSGRKRGRNCCQKSQKGVYEVILPQIGHWDVDVRFP